MLASDRKGQLRDFGLKRNRIERTYAVARPGTVT